MLANLSLIAFQSASFDEASAAMACITSKTGKEHILFNRTQHFSMTTSAFLIISATSVLIFHKSMFIVPETFPHIYNPFKIITVGG